MTHPTTRSTRLASRLVQGRYGGVARHVHPAGDAVPTPYLAPRGELYTFEIRDGLLCCLFEGEVVADENAVHRRGPGRERWTPTSDTPKIATRLYTHVTADTAAKVKRKAARLGISESSYIRKLLEVAMEHEQQRNAAVPAEEEE